MMEKIIEISNKEEDLIKENNDKSVIINNLEDILSKPKCKETGQLYFWSLSLALYIGDLNKRNELLE